MAMRHNGIEVTFMCPQFDADAEELAVLGIAVRRSRGVVRPRVEDGKRVVEIGAVIVRGPCIEVVPRGGLTDWQAQTLLGVAEDAFHQPPRKRDGWRFTQEGKDPRWITWVTVEDEEGAAVEVNQLAARPDCRPARHVA